jgi:PIN domain nuclease of toxin-antitoxin system
MAGNVLDASAIIAFLGREAGADMVAEVLSGAMVSAVNLAEVITWLGRRGTKTDEVLRVVSDLALDVTPFDAELAMTVGLLDHATKKFGLSLGDRACLALAQHLSLPVLTADRAWAKLNLGVEITLIR